jgi:hypothetical protein
MRRLIVVTLLLLIASAIANAVPIEVPYTGNLTEKGRMVNGIRYFTLTLYVDSVGGRPMTTQAEFLAVNDGVYRTVLAPPWAIWDDSHRWLGVSVNRGPELLPRTKIHPVPSRVRSWVADMMKNRSFVGITCLQDSVRTDFPADTSVVVEQFIVNKKSPDSILLIQGEILCLSPTSKVFIRDWTYGSDDEVSGENIACTPNSADSTQITATIAGHPKTGPQLLTLRYHVVNDSLGSKPILIYNPNGTDIPALGQTRSTFIVSELEP